MKKRQTLSARLMWIMLASMLLVAGMLLAGSVVTNSRQYEQLYNQNTRSIVKMTAKQLDGDFLSELYKEINTDEFSKIQKAAENSDDDEPVVKWLKEKGLYEKFVETNNLLDTIQTNLDVEYLYIQVIENHKSIYLIDPTEPYLTLGYTEELTGEFRDLTGNERVEPTVSKTELGWLSSGGEPVLTSQGEKCAVCFVDIDMTEIVEKTIRFVVVIGILCVVVLLLVGILVTNLIRKKVSRPVEQLTAATVRFGNGEDGYQKENIAKLDIHTGDEIEELYHATRKMQESIIDYMENLTRVTAEKERIGAELNVATQIQADMLPRIFPAFPNRKEFALYATMTPAKEVGGDFYDFFLVDEDHLALVMADVSGKGVPAALFMVIAKTLIKNRAQMGATPSEVLAYANEQLCEGNEAELFVTVWLAIIEISTGKGLAANAGHEHPAIRRAGGQWELVVYRHSPAVATMEGLRFREHEFELHPGDRLYVYTDGVAEATDQDNNLYGTERMLCALNRNPDASPEELLQNVREDIDVFVGGAPQFDDITMLGLSWYGGGGQA